MVRLPAEYQEVEYIQGTSNARIDTGIPGNNNDLVISGKVYLNKFSAYQGFFGNYIDEDHNTSRLILGATANGAVIANINCRAASSSVTQVGFYAGNAGEFKVSKRKLIFNGTEYSYGGVNNATANDTNILLNVANPASIGSDSELYRRWYYFQINDGDTALRNYIPCYRKSDSKPGMYDTVTNQFFAGYGTEEFIVGNDVSWDTASLIERRRQILLNTPHLTTESANPLTFQTDISANLKDCKIYFEPVQEGSGDPSPDNIRAISGWDGWLFNAHGQNFWNDEDYAKASWHILSKDPEYYSGTLQHMRDINGGYGLFDEFMPLGRVNVSFDRRTAGSTIRMYFHYTDASGWVNHSGNDTSNGHKSWTSDAGRVCNGAKIYTTAGAAAEGAFKNMQITLSDTELPYRPFEGVRKHIVPYEIAGKNLFSIGGCSKYFYTNVSGEMAINTNSMCSDYIPVSPNTEYVFSGINKYSGNTAVRIHAYDSNKNWIEQISYISGIASGDSFELPLVTPGNAAYIRTSSAMPLGNAQFELGSTATAYDPFKTIYGGYIDIVNGVLVEEWSQIASYNGETLPDEWISDRDVYTAGTSPTIGAQVAYKLATPIAHQLTPQVIKTLKGINNIWSDANGSIEIKYWGH